uniref:Uncharacterized protein n=1 Tax=Acrobeloides nanus TaxID=290746 RepID=A0A914DDZ3_9BILA
MDKEDELFDLSEFMMKHHLEKGLIGINWIMVGADAYAIEKQRIRGLVDNCHSLVVKKLARDRRWEFVDMFPLNEMDAWLSASYKQPQASYEVCCSKIELNEETLYLDPLADGEISSIAVHNQPQITSLRSIQQQPADNYQRSLRHYIIMKEDKYTLLMFDPKRAYVHWLLVDIPSASLASGNIIDDGLQVASYVPPIPDKPNDCYFVLFMLFRQPRSSQSMSEVAEFYNSDHPLRSKYCVHHCVYRGAFNVAQFKSFHRLSLSATSWMKVCYDIHEAARQIRSIKETNVTEEVKKSGFHNGGQKLADDNGPKAWSTNSDSKHRKKHDIKSSQIESICNLIRPQDKKCTSTSGISSSLKPLSVVILVLLCVSFISKAR